MKNNSIFPLTIIAVIICLLIFYLTFVVNSSSNPNPELNQQKLHTMEISGQLQVRKESVDARTVKYSFLDGESHFLTYRSAMKSLKEDKSDGLGKLITKILQEEVPSSEAIFWECAPVKYDNYESKPFEFVLISAPSLAKRTVDPEAFGNQFRRFSSSNAGPMENEVISFENLGKDATLVVPYPSKSVSNLQYFTHLSSFIQQGDSVQVAKLWKMVGEKFEEAVLASGTPQWLWLSTSGLGVSWLHVRIDLIPKYYNYGPYKNPR
jgi:hypothetical protein